MSWRLALLLAALGAAWRPAGASDYRIDPDRSHAQFSVRLLWLRTASGRFTGIAGQVRLRPDGTASVDASIAVDSVVMEAAWMRRFALAEAFFDAAHYPAIRFASAPVPLRALAEGGELDGLLTLRGVTRPVRFELRPAACPQPGVRPCQLEVQGSVSRSEFGMTAHRATLSDEVKLGLSVTLAPAP
ncbi:YceI family protein [Fulvimonas soli]|uniref:Polyisoprenoid-binding protein YceI n=1 Tax=Fulvimonas soli TaxID=155197 RepID=A0A316IZD6_9GAMM|nr:YceI family protein [Fulvimonas soli]PWK92605.1 polyisoprenoid-binding protein YceI [Fulvimonas soli]